jgi:hypothetical protein
MATQPEKANLVRTCRISMKLPSETPLNSGCRLCGTDLEHQKIWSSSSSVTFMAACRLVFVIFVCENAHIICVHPGLCNSMVGRRYRTSCCFLELNDVILIFYHEEPMISNMCSDKMHFSVGLIYWLVLRIAFDYLTECAANSSELPLGDTLFCY